MVKNVNYDDGKSKIEVAFELLVLRGLDVQLPASSLENLDLDDLEEFAAHCVNLCKTLSSTGENSSQATITKRPQNESLFLLEEDDRDDEDIDDNDDADGDGEIIIG